VEETSLSETSEETLLLPNKHPLYKHENVALQKKLVLQSCYVKFLLQKVA